MSSDDNVVPESAFAAKLAAARNRLGVTQPAVPATTQQAPTSTAPTPAGPNPSVPDEDIPQVELNINPEEEAVDLAIKNLSIVDAYAKWCAKMTPKISGGQRESVMISCPNPMHPDTNPSAWMNLDKNVYYCPGCSYGGDVWDIAAMAYGYSAPAYKNDPAAFRKVREMMALDLGFTITRGYSGTFIVPPVEETDEPSGSTEPPQAQDATAPVEASGQDQEDAATQELPAQGNPVGKLPAAIEMEQREQDYLASRDAPSIKWREIIPEETFLHAWMEACTVDNSPEEFHVWTGLMALAFGIGRHKTLVDLPDVVGNMFVCLVGPSGAGKSRASRHLREILDRVMRWDPSSFQGVKSIKQPGSAEYLIQAFTANEEDPSNPGNVIQHSVKGLVEFGELATLMSVGGRAGSALKPQLMDIYDAALEVSSGSLTHGYRAAREPFGQCLSTTQNDSLRNLLDKSDDASGFMNRWVFAQGPLKPPIARGGTRVDLSAPSAQLSAIYTWSHMGGTEVDWSGPAGELWDEFFMSTLHPTKTQAEKNGSAMLNRLDLLMKKLILLFTANLMSNVVPKAAVEQAIALYPYLLQTYGVVGAQISRTEDSDLVNKVLGVIERLTVANGSGPTKRDLYQSVRGTIKTTKQLGDLLKTMVELEIIREVVPARKPGQRGQLGVRYAVAN